MVDMLWIYVLEWISKIHDTKASPNKMSTSWIPNKKYQSNIHMQIVQKKKENPLGIHKQCFALMCIEESTKFQFRQSIFFPVDVHFLTPYFLGWPVSSNSDKLNLWNEDIHKNRMFFLEIFYHVCVLEICWHASSCNMIKSRHTYTQTCKDR